MSALSAAERHIIQSLLETEYGSGSHFLRQLAAARVDKRRLTGVGIYVDLSVPHSAPRVDRVNAELSAGYSTPFPTPGDLVGFTLFIRDGSISFLEGYTYGDVPWPRGPMEEWLILDSVEAAPQEAK